MIRRIPVLLVLAALCPTLRAEEPQPDFTAEEQALERAYTQAERDFFQPPASEGKEKPRPDWSKHPAREYGPKFRDLAERAKGSEAACAALIWLLTNGQSAGGQGTEEISASLQTLAASHAGSARLEAVVGRVPNLQYNAGYEACAAFLEKVMKDSPHRSVRAGAIMAMAYLLDGKVGATSKDKDAARALLHGLLKDYADTPAAGRAKGLLFELERLQIGMEAPDFEIRDQDDKPFKLSEYRGKVAVIDFWGFW